ncbi:MAG: transporter substrate-binding protein [Ramlibacter sp.]|nr:transporter substrate-binding protein [Ramlibacter sp.]
MSIKTLALVAALALNTLGAVAQTAWPSKPITVVVPYAAGTSPDVVVRTIAPELGRRLGQSVLVDNTTGAGGVIGTDRVVRAPADGYTLVLGVESTVLIAQMVSPSTVKYDGLKDLTPVTLMASAPLVIVGKPSLPASTLPELMAMLRAAPDKYSYGTSGVGTSLHLAGEIFNQVANTRLTHVPYRVSSQLVTEVAGNQIDLAILPVGSVTQQIRAGKMKAFAVTSSTRSPALPEVAAIGEIPSLKDVEVTVWFGLLAPAGTEPAIVNRLHAETAEILKDPVIRAKFADLGMSVIGAGPQQFSSFMVGEQRKFARIVKDRNIRVD